MDEMDEMDEAQMALQQLLVHCGIPWRTDALAILDLKPGLLNLRWEGLLFYVNDKYAHRNTTALMMAGAGGDLALVLALLERGADLHARNIVNWTALNGAALWARTPEVCELLLSRGADLMAASSGGFTALREYGFAGHYVSDVLRNDEWWHCDDTSVRRTSQKQVLNVAREGYLLFYTFLPDAAALQAAAQAINVDANDPELEDLEMELDEENESETETEMQRQIFASFGGGARIRAGEEPPGKKAKPEVGVEAEDEANEGRGRRPSRKAQRVQASQRQKDAAMIEAQGLVFDAFGIAKAEIDVKLLTDCLAKSSWESSDAATDYAEAIRRRQLGQGFKRGRKY